MIHAARQQETLVATATVVVFYFQLKKGKGPQKLCNSVSTTLDSGRIAKFYQGTDNWKCC